MPNRYTTFLSPIQIGKVKLKNRAVMTAMGTGYAEAGGYVGDRLIAYHVERAIGGIGMNTVEISPVHESSAGPRYVSSYDDRFLPGLTRLATAIKEHGGVACIQLQHFGRSMSSKESGMPLLAPSAIPCPLYQEMPMEMTLEDIQMIIKAFGEAALRVKKAGFDVIELHGAHGYLIGSFMSPFSNKRTDRYGGSLRNRMRFPLEVLAEVRCKVGDELPIMMRISGDEQVEGGLRLLETIEIARLLEQAGLDALNVSQGNHGAMSYETPNMYMEEQTHVEVAAAIKLNLHIPVLVAGRITTPDIAESILEAGKADLIGLGRVLLADPQFVRKTMEGRRDEIIRCMSCNQGCVNRMFSGKGSPSCVFNPVTGRELEYKIIPAPIQKRVLVIGGGPAGLEAARTLQERGHHVDLLEKSDGLGGQFILAGVSPRKRIFKEAAFSMGFRAYKAGVHMHLSTGASQDIIAALRPDEIVIAIGSEPVLLEIDGVNVANQYEAREVLSGEVTVQAESVAVIGGGLVGIETAQLLADLGKRVVLIEAQAEIGSAIGFQTRPYVMNALKDGGVEVYTEARCVGLTNHKLLLNQRGKSIELIGIHAVIMAAGSHAGSDVVDMVKGMNIPYHIIGDANRVGDALDAIWAGADIGRMI